MQRLESQRLERDGLLIVWAAVTDVGKVRRLNEDSYLDAPGAFVVADGMGGHQAGDVASRLTIEAVRQFLSADLPDVAVIGQLVERANDLVRAHAATAGREGMGSTLVGAFLVQNADEESVVIVNVGDSRCYSLVDGVLGQLTKDHSVVQELVDAGEISANDALTHDERNVVTRAIGIEAVVAGDFFVVPELPFVRLLLCSDGVSGELSFDRIAELLAANEDPGDAAIALIDDVLTGRASDNATAIVVDIHRQPAEDELAPNPLDITGPRPARVESDPESTEDATALLTTAPALVLSDLISAVPESSTPEMTAQVNVVIDDVPR